MRRIVALSRTTAATTSGPAQAPRPASSTPATGVRPARASTFSYAASPALRRGVWPVCRHRARWARSGAPLAGLVEGRTMTFEGYARSPTAEGGTALTAGSSVTGLPPEAQVLARAGDARPGRRREAGT